MAAENSATNLRVLSTGSKVNEEGTMETRSKQVAKQSVAKVAIELRVEEFKAFMRLASGPEKSVWSGAVSSPILPHAIWKLGVHPCRKHSRTNELYSNFEVCLSWDEEANARNVTAECHIYAVSARDSYKWGMVNSNPVQCLKTGCWDCRMGENTLCNLQTCILHPDGSLLVLAEIKIFLSADDNSRALLPSASRAEGEALQGLKRGRLNMLETGLHSDCRIVVGGETIKVHKCILAASSPYFKVMFTEGFGYKEAIDGVVRIADFSPEPVRAMLDFIYTGEIDWASRKARSEESGGGGDGGEWVERDVLQLADKYEMLELKAHMEERMEVVSVGQLVELVRLADVFNSNTLMKTCAYYLMGHQREVLSSAEWRKLKAADPKLTIELLEVMMLG